MIVYLDTSSLVKLYVEEAGSDAVRRLVSEAEKIAASVIAYPEARSALARRRREGGLSASDHRSAGAAFESDWRRLVRVGVTETLCRAAAGLAERHALKALDSLHLASFLALRRRLPRQRVAFSSYDKRLNRAAGRARRASVSHS